MLDATKNVQAVVGGKKYTLTVSDHLGSGGQASIYLKGKTVFKIYHDPKHLIPERKVDELKTLDRPNILKPEDMVFSPQQAPIGFTMQYADSTLPLVKLFSNGFWRKNQVKPKTVLQLVENLLNDTQFIHGKSILVVDYNELNFLIDEQDFSRPFFIDVDSYQTPSFKAPAIAPGIRDWHASEWSELTDWFSFAIVACQLFIGAHPYKGEHPKFSKSDFEGKMKANASIFGSVTYPSKARDISHIPSDYCNWFKELFEDGKRTPPPAIAGLLNVVVVPVQVIQASDSFVMSFLKETDGDILWHDHIFGSDVLATADLVYVGDVSHSVLPDTDVILTPEQDHVFANIQGGKLDLNCNYDMYRVDLECRQKFVHNNTLFVVSNDKLMQIDFHLMGKKMVSSIGNHWNVLPNATKAYNQFCVSDIFGKKHFYIPYYVNTKVNCSIIHLPELDEYRIINAKRGDNVIVVVAYKNSKYDRLVFKFDEKFVKYAVRVSEDVVDHDINFAVLNTGVVILFTDTNTVEIFSAVMDNDQVKAIQDNQLDANVTLTARASRAAFFLGEKLFDFKTK